jgi:hypothetical protein
MNTKLYSMVSRVKVKIRELEKELQKLEDMIVDGES